MKPRPPYYILSFNRKKPESDEGLVSTNVILSNLDREQQPGFLGVDENSIDDSSVKTFWQDLESIRFFKMNEAHLANNDHLRRDFYGQYDLDITKHVD